MPSPELILASTSAYRAEILARLKHPFRQLPPGTDETPLPDENPLALAERLAVSKAQAVHSSHASAVVIGGDQVAVCGDEALGKPGTPEIAAAQLQKLSGMRVFFHSALTVIGPDAIPHSATDTTVVQFRKLSDTDIARYLQKEAALDCAGAFKSEGLGITLCNSIRSDDPTGLIGLPLIKLCALLRAAGLDILQAD